MNNKTLFNLSKRIIPGGVNSPVRAFQAVGGTPVFFNKGKGSKVVDVEGNEYIDFVGSWGPLILGHSHPVILSKLSQVMKKGLSFGVPTKIELEFAETIKKYFPSMQMIRLVSSGTEATMTAIRLARGYTNKDLIIKFTGCYHGHSDSLLVKAGSGALTLGTPSSPGIPAELTNKTIVLEFNDVDQLDKAFKLYANKIACVIVEPIAGNMNFIPASNVFINKLRELTKKNKSVLIFDEVMTGFRVALGGAQSLFKVKPDITTLGKVIGGGLPIGAIGGKKEIMKKLSPTGDVYQAGTLSGNPLSVTAGLETVKLISKSNFFISLNNKTKFLVDSINDISEKKNVNISARGIGGMFGFYFRKTPPTNYDQAVDIDMKSFKYFFHFLLKNGVYIAPSAFEAGFLSIKHSTNDLKRTVSLIEKFFK